MFRRLIIINNNILKENKLISKMSDILTEEPNTSLMYHKLFPNRKLLQALEQRGYKFSMGDGLKLQRKYFSSQHRLKGGPKRQRMIPSLIIHKNGVFFRKIPKADWVRLSDPSDKDSLTFGEKFMRKLLAAEIKQTDVRLRKAKEIDSNRSMV